MHATLAFLALLLPLTLSPGPATIALASQGMRCGMVGSLPFLSGLIPALGAYRARITDMLRTV